MKTNKQSFVLLIAIFGININQISPLDVRSFGRKAVLGQLYDARTDTFLPDTIIKRELPEKLKFITTPRSASLGKSLTRWKYAPKYPGGDNTIFGYNELERLEILCDYIKPIGAGQFFKRSEINSDAAIIISKLESMTRNELLPAELWTKGWEGFTQFKKYLNLEPLKKNTSATHVVFGILWGRDAAILLEDKEGKQIHPNYALSLLRDSSEKNPRDQNITVKFLTDIPPKSVFGYSQTADDLRINYQYLWNHTLNYNKGLGIQKKFALEEIHGLRKLFNVTAKNDGLSQPPFEPEISFKSIDVKPRKVFEIIAEFEHKYQKLENQMFAIPSLTGSLLKAYRKEVGSGWNETVGAYKKDLMKFINLRRSKSKVPPTLIQTLDQTAEKIKQHNLDKKDEFEFYKMKTNLGIKYSKIGLPFYLGDSPNGLTFTTYTALIIPSKSFKTEQDFDRYSHIENFFLKRFSGPKAVIDCDSPNQFCTTNPEPKDPIIVLINKGKFTTKINYTCILTKCNSRL